MRCSAEAGAPSGLRAAPRGLGGAAPANARTNALTESLAASEHADEVHEGQSLLAHRRPTTSMLWPRLGFCRERVRLRPYRGAVPPGRRSSADGGGRGRRRRKG